MDRLTTTIKRPWLTEIIAGTKKIEYREIKPYWRDRLAQVKVPFEALAHDRAGQWSIRINDQWRICFRFENGDVYDVEIVDYH